MSDQNPERPAPLDYAGPDVRKAPRDPMSYYREPPAVAGWTPGMLVFSIVLVVAVVGLLYGLCGR